MRKLRQSRRWAFMTVTIWFLLVLSVLGGAVPFSMPRLGAAHAQPPPQTTLAAAEHALQLRATPAHVRLSRLPLSFEAAPDHSAAGNRFFARGNGYALYLSNTDAIFLARMVPRATTLHSTTPRSASLRFHLVGANERSVAMGMQRQQGTVNYFMGADRRQWQTGVSTYGSVAYRDAYPGINLVYYGTQGDLEYDFRIAPGARPSRIRLQIVGSSGLRLDRQGNLVVATNLGSLVEAKPILYQNINGRRSLVPGHYILIGHDEVGFAVGAYDMHLPLVIDPRLTYSDVFGVNDQPANIALDRAGDVYVVGTTYSVVLTTTTVLTTTEALPAAYTNACPINTPNPCATAFVAKFNARGNRLLYSSYIGGTYNAHNPPSPTASNYGTGIAVDGAGNAYVTGYSNATNFPTSVHAFQPTNRGGNDAFVAKFSSNGRHLIYSSLLGGTTDNAGVGGDDIATGIASDRAGNAYVTGYTYTYNFPIKNGLLGALGYGKGTLGTQVDAFVTKVNPRGTSLVYSTYLGGSGTDYAYAIALDPSGDAYVAGQTNSADFQTPPHALQAKLFGTDFNSFVAKLNRDGNRLVYATYLGQSAADKIHAIAVDVAGNAFIVGETRGGIPQTVGYAQPTSGGGIDAFVAKLSARGVLTYSTYLGGVGDDIANALAVDGRGNVYVAGSTGSAEFNTPVFPLRGALQGQLGGNRGGFGMLDAFVAKVNSCGSGLLYSSYFGGTFVDNATAIAVDGAGNAIVAGSTLSPNFPLTGSLPGGKAYIPSSPNAFIAQISGEPEPPRRVCPVPLLYTLSATQISIASTVPLTVTVHTAPFAKVDLGLVVKNSVPPPPPPTPTPAKGTKVKHPRLPHYPKIGEIIYRLHVRGTADAYGLYIGSIRPKFATTVSQPAVITITTAASHSVSSSSAQITVGP